MTKHIDAVKNRNGCYTYAIIYFPKGKKEVYKKQKEVLGFMFLPNLYRLKLLENDNDVEYTKKQLMLETERFEMTMKQKIEQVECTVSDNPKIVACVFPESLDYVYLESDTKEGMDFLSEHLNLKYTAPYYVSVSKGFNKYCVKVINIPKEFKDKANIFIGKKPLQFEIHIRQCTFVDLDAEEFNSHLEPPMVDFSMLAIDYTPPVTKMKTKNLYLALERNNNADELKEKDLEYLLLKVLPSEYSSTFELWRNMCFNLKGWNEERGLIMFKKFSALCPEKYNETNTEIFYNMQGKADCPVGYFINLSNKYNHQIFLTQEVTLGNDTDEDNININLFELTDKICADYFCKTKFAKRHVFCRTTDKWYYCNDNNHWIESKQPYEFFNSISPLFRRLLETKLKKMKHPAHVEFLKNKLKEVESCKFIINVKPIIQSNLLHDNFLDKLDTKPYLVCFKNGVYDLNKDEFRKTEPCDYISLYRDYDYEECIEYFKEELAVIYEFFDGLFISDEVKEWVLDHLASFMNGRTLGQYFYIFTGVGSNGKSILQDLLTRCFSNKGITLNASNLCNKKRNANDHSEWASTRGKKLAFLGEPATDAIVQAEEVKSKSSGDQISEREMYKANYRFHPYFAMIMFCNKIPKLSVYDDAISRRLLVVHFPFKFKNKQDIDKATIENAEDLHMMRLEDQKFDKMKTNIKYVQAFSYMLIRRYQERVRNRQINIPDQIFEYIKEYEGDNPVYNWLKQYYEVDRQGKMSAQVLNYEYNEKFPFKNLNESEFGKQLSLISNMKDVKDKLGDKTLRFKDSNIYYRLSRKNFIDEENDNPQEEHKHNYECLLPL